MWERILIWCPAVFFWTCHKGISFTSRCELEKLQRQSYKTIWALTVQIENIYHHCSGGKTCSQFPTSLGHPHFTGRVLVASLWLTDCLCASEWKLDVSHVKGFIHHINTKFNDALSQLLIKWNCIQEQLKTNSSYGNMRRMLWIRVINSDKRWKSGPMHH